jgi:hypothetical protein
MFPANIWTKNKVGRLGAVLPIQGRYYENLFLPKCRFHAVVRLHGGLHPKIARRSPQGYILDCAIRGLAPAAH